MNTRSILVSGADSSPSADTLKYTLNAGRAAPASRLNVLIQLSGSMVILCAG